MNCNDNVWVKLTPYGWGAFNTYYQSLGLDQGPYFAALLDDATYHRTSHQRFQLWELMHIFGPVCFNGAPGAPFERNEIYFEPPPE